MKGWGWGIIRSWQISPCRHPIIPFQYNASPLPPIHPSTHQPHSFQPFIIFFYLLIHSFIHSSPLSYSFIYSFILSFIPALYHILLFTHSFQPGPLFFLFTYLFIQTLYYILLFTNSCQPFIFSLLFTHSFQSFIICFLFTLQNYLS